MGLDGTDSTDLSATHEPVPEPPLLQSLLPPVPQLLSPPTQPPPPPPQSHPTLAVDPTQTGSHTRPKTAPDNAALTPPTTRTFWSAAPTDPPLSSVLVKYLNKQHVSVLL